MESIMNKFTSLTTFNQPNYKQTSAYFTSKITNTVADEVSDCIGLDFGNSNICVSYHKNQLFNVFQLGSQSCCMPAWLTLKEKEFFVGTAAKNTQHQKSTKLTVFDIRRALSLNPISAIGLPYQITKELEFKGSNNTTIPLVRVMAIMIAAIKEKLEKALNEEIKNVVLTIPTSFGIQQQQILVDACQIANLKVVKLLFEPVATAITYYSIKKSEKKIICIIDFGGGKLDVANFVIENGRIELLNSATDLELGGRDFDEKLVNYVVGILKRKYPNIVVNDRVMTRIREKCILGKESLTTFSQKSIELDDIGDDDVTINITRIEFETICNDLFKRALSLISRVTNSIDKTRINDVVLVGGSSRMPKFQTDLKQIFPNIPFNVTLNADEAIAKGACMYGALKSGMIKKFKLEDKIPWKGQKVHSPKANTFVDKNGIVQYKIVEDSANRYTDIKHEQNEIKKMSEKHEETVKDYKEIAKVEKEADNEISVLIEKYSNPNFAKYYERQGYDIAALKSLNQYLQQYLEHAAKVQVTNYFAQRIEICVKAIDLYQKWVPSTYSSCQFLDYEIKKLCSYSFSMDNNALETHQQYINLVRFYLEKRYELNPYYSLVLKEPSKSMIEKIKLELDVLRASLETFHRTNQRVIYDVHILSDLIAAFLQSIRGGQ